MKMIYGSLFAGIKGDKGFTDARWECRWAVEIEPFCQAVLRTRYPGLPIFGNIRDCGARNLEYVDLITAGVPCQDVSIAGKRAGLAGSRTGLFYEFARILRELRPAWFVFENVPGLLSSNGGRDFAEVLRVLMAECGYGVSWRVLNSQFFGVAQRRRRVFVVGSFGRPCPGEILFDTESGGGDSAPSVEAGKRTTERPSRGVAGSLKGASLSRRTVNSEKAADGYLVARPLTQSAFKRHDEDTATLIATPLSAGSCHRSHPGGRRREDDFKLVMQPIRTNPYNNSDPGMEIRALVVAKCLDGHHRQVRAENGNYIIASPDADGMRDVAGLPEGLDDSFPLLPRGLDSARYRALGNAWTVQVGRWVAERITKLG